MKRKNKQKPTRRRKPVQQRAQVTVDAMLSAVILLLKRGGIASITTNRIAQVAGVSIGSVYQYFPNKHAIFAALHEHHIRRVDEVMLRRIMDCEDGSLEELVQSLLDGMIEVHNADPELSELLQTEVPHRKDGTVEFSVRLHDAFRRALAPHSKSFGRRSDLSAQTFVVANMVDALGHAIIRNRPRSLSLKRAKEETSRAILGYLVERAATESDRRRKSNDVNTARKRM